jgi:Phospholipase_D-nuclease N-terminal
MLLRLGGIFFVIGLVLWLWALFDSVTAPADRVRLLPKLLWILIVVIFTDVGAVLWFLAGRPRATAGAPARPVGFGWQSHGSSGGARRRPSAPDDDPEFLRRLAEDVRRKRRAEGQDESDGGS